MQYCGFSQEYPVRKFSRLSLLSLTLLMPGLAQAQSGATLQKVKETGTITIGYRESSAPFSYLDDHQKPVGGSGSV